jgi:hypothetical protein
MSVWWQKCTRAGLIEWIRPSDRRQAAGSLACPDGSLLSGGPAYWRGGYAASPISRSGPPAADCTTTH